MNWSLKIRRTYMKITYTLVKMAIKTFSVKIASDDYIVIHY